MLASNHFGYHQAKQRQSHHANLPKRLRHPVAAARPSQQPSAGKPNHRADHQTIAQLLPDELCQARRPAFDLGRCQRHEEKQKWNGQPIVEPRLHVQRLADAHRHARAVHDHLSQPSVSRSKNRRQNPRLPQRELRKHQACDDRCPERSSATNPCSANEWAGSRCSAGRGSSARLPSVNSNITSPISASLRKTFRLNPASQKFRQERKHQHSGNREDHRRGEHRLLEPPRYQCIPKQQHDK